MSEHKIKQIIFSAIVLVALDQLFLFANRKMYVSSVEKVQHIVIQPRYLGWLSAYVSIVVALFWFILRNHRPIWEAMLLGLLWNAAFEGFLYGFFTHWSLDVAIIDTLWGSVLFGLTTAIVYKFV